jgi:preprotein translocase subunit SecE
MADKIKLSIAFLLVAAGVVAFYALHDSPTVVKVAAMLLSVLLAAGVVWTSEPGKRLFSFGKESVAEAKRVSWPTRKETLQMTAVVIAFAIIMALFLWGVDAILMVVVDKLMGRSA